MNAKHLARATSITNQDGDSALAAIAAAVRSIGTARKNLQAAAVIAIGYANVHGNIKVANSCLTAIRAAKGSKGIKLQAWVTYIEQNAAMRYDGDLKAFAHVKDANVIRDPEQLVIALSKTCWEDAIPTKEVESMHDCMKDVKALLAKLDKLAKSGCELENDFVVEGLVKLRDYVA